jgi:hypothetical protein
MDIIIPIIANIISGSIIGLVVGYYIPKKLVIFSKLYEERATVIKEMFQKLTELQDAMIKCTDTILGYGGEDTVETKKDLCIRAYDVLMDCNRFYVLNQLFFGNEIDTKIYNIISECNRVYRQYSDNTAAMKDNVPKDFEMCLDIRESVIERHTECVKANTEIKDKMSKELPPIIEELKKDFRKMIGIKE